ncbi:MBL fold metallo-hydrolase [bacterium]|nr:MBL fold metallo-hydrolase [bacterium]
MKIADVIYLVGSGQAGFMISNRSDSHVYVIEGSKGHVMIDAGVGIQEERIAENMKKDGINPKDVKYLLLTHTHSDHAGGAAWFKKQYGVKVYVSRAEAEFLRSSDQMDLGLDIAIIDGIYPSDYRFPNCEPDVEVGDGDTFTFGNLSIRAIHTPGHSLGSICYLLEKGNRTCLFSGDVVVHGGKLMFLNCAGSVMADMRASMPKLARLGVEELYPGHGCFVLENGQNHIDIAIENLRHLSPPQNAF